MAGCVAGALRDDCTPFASRARMEEWGDLRPGPVGERPLATERPPKGQRDYSGVRLTRHALERFVERYGVEPGESEAALREALKRTRRIGRNPLNGAVAVLTLHLGRVLVAILQEEACLTVLTWNQFEPRMAEFGRARLPRKRGRMLRRLTDFEGDDPA